jgi:hypothetical protein
VRDQQGLGIMRQAMISSVFGREGTALLLLLGAAAWMSSPDQVLAADLSDKTPLFHPLAADLNQLAENVRRSTPCIVLLYVLCYLANCRHEKQT